MVITLPRGAMCCSMACVAFAWAAWINLIDFRLSHEIGYHMKFNQIHHNDTTYYSKIQWEQLHVHACKAVLPNCKLLAPAVQLNRGNPADHHSPCADCGLGRPRSNHCAVIFAFCTIATKKYKWERKTWKKHSFSDGKRFTDFVLLRCFIDFQTTLVDSRNLVIFSTFW
jgi:hypothetical protein